MSKELNHIKECLKAIEQKKQSLEDQLTRLTDQEHSLTLRGIELKHGIKIGSIVSYRGTEHRVTAIDTEWGVDKPWLTGNPKKKDGTWGATRRKLFSRWEKVS